MKARKQSSTAYPQDKQSVQQLSTKVADLLQESVPNDILGMLATARTDRQQLVFYNRWQLVIHSKNDYEIYDIKQREIIYSHVTLLSSAVKIIFQLNRSSARELLKHKMIYELDQEYYRCIEKIQFYREKMKTNNKDLHSLFAMRYSDRQLKLAEIKHRLSKLN